eukprot:9484155-Alexandrium_andersonii.AAC.1
MARTRRARALSVVCMANNTWATVLPEVSSSASCACPGGCRAPGAPAAPRQGLPPPGLPQLAPAVRT